MPHDIPVEAMLPSSSHNSSTSGTIMHGCGFCGRLLRSILYFFVILCCMLFLLFSQYAQSKKGLCNKSNSATSCFCFKIKSPTAKAGGFVVLFFYCEKIYLSFLQKIAPTKKEVAPLHTNSTLNTPSIVVTKGLPISLCQTRLMPASVAK